MRKTSVQNQFASHVYDPNCTKLMSIIKGQDLNESVRYSATITLKPRMYQYKAEQQYDMTYPDLIKHLLCNGVHKMTVISELTKNFNIHMHLTITVLIPKDCGKSVNIQKKFVDSFRKSPVFGFVNIKQISEDENGWVEYISKDFQSFVDSTGRRPILKDDFDYFSETDYALFGTEW